MDATSQKIIDAAMCLIRDRGYVATTTKDIAKAANVNECTLFRKFKNKQDIALSGIRQEKWRGNMSMECFKDVVWELQPDLEMFMRTYMHNITPDFVNLSIGLRAPQLYDEAAPYIMQVPQAFISALTNYFEQMQQRGKLPPCDIAHLTMTIFSSTFGYTFLKASFQDRLMDIEDEDYIRSSVNLFIEGLPAL